MEKTITIKALFKYGVLGILFIVFITGSYLVGYHQGASHQKVKIDDKLLSYNNLTKKIDVYTTNIKEQQEELKSLQADIVEENSQKEKLKKEVSELTLETMDKEFPLIDEPPAPIITKVEERSLSAGTYNVGQDIAPGKYKIDSQGKTGEFTLNDYSGKIKEREFFLTRDNTSYVVRLDNGDVLKLRMSAKITPIK